MWLFYLFIFLCNRIYLFLPKILYVEVRISRSISRIHLDFEIMRVDCIEISIKDGNNKNQPDTPYIGIGPVQRGEVAVYLA